MIESIIFDILSQGKKVSSLSLLNEYEIPQEDLKKMEMGLYSHDQILTISVLICPHCGNIVHNGVFYKPHHEKSTCFACKGEFKGSSRILIFSKKKIEKKT